MLKKELSSVENWKEANEKLHCDMSMQLRVTLFFSLISLLTLFLWNMQWNISEHFEAYGDEGDILRQKLERSFL